MNIHLPAIFDVHQGYKVLTHCHIVLVCSDVSLVLFGPEKKPCQGEVLGAYEQMLEQLRWGDLMEMIRCLCVQRWIKNGYPLW
jgi:hypothetical protein